MSTNKTRASCSTFPMLKFPTGYSTNGASSSFIPEHYDTKYFNAYGIWTDGTNIYKNEGYVLVDGEWQAKTWQGYTNLWMDYIWTDGTNIYYSYGTKQYVLNGDTWEAKTWQGCTSFNANSTWTDGANIYCSNDTSHYVLNGSTWEVKTWQGLDSFSGYYVWADATSIYCSLSETEHYILNGDTWEATTFNLGSLSDLDVGYIWTDGINTYYSYNKDQYILNGNNWEVKTWQKIPYFYASEIWYDGGFVHCASCVDDVNYHGMLLPSTAKLYTRFAHGWLQMGSIE